MNGFSREIMEAPVKKVILFDKKGKTGNLPVVMKDDSVEKVIEVGLKYPHAKSVYVINENRELAGLITIRGLMKHLFSFYHKPQAHSGRILQTLTAEVASEIMHKEVYFKTENDTIENVLHYMIKGGTDAIPIVDDQKKVLHEISLRAILRFLHKS